uniref:Uncharacterized protein n=1 Tax=Angiostrongylus cantonensis TaxID=6313 RepID=A0A0K0DBM9_ANGCA
MSSVSTTPTSSTEQNTIQYTRLLAGGNGGGGGGSDGNKSANTSMSSEKGGVCRPTSHYPTVCVQVPHAPLSSVSAPPRDVPYAVPYPKPVMAGLEESVAIVEIPPDTLHRQLVRNRLYDRLRETENCAICPFGKDEDCMSSGT